MLDLATHLLLKLYILTKHLKNGENKDLFQRKKLSA